MHPELVLVSVPIALALVVLVGWFTVYCYKKGTAPPSCPGCLSDETRYLRDSAGRKWWYCESCRKRVQLSGRRTQGG